MASKKKTRSYPQNVLDAAIAAIRGGLSQRKASAQFGVPQSTLSDYTRGRSQPGISKF